MPQMPDTRIALSGIGSGGGQSQGYDALNTLGSLMKIKEGQLVLKQRQREEEDDLATEDALQQYERPDDAVDHLWRAGRPDAASKLAKNVYDDRSARARAASDEMKLTQNRLEQAATIMNGVTDDQSLKLATPAIGSLLEPVFGKGIYDQIGTTYNEDTKKKLVNWGYDAAERINIQNNAIARQQEAWRLGLERDPKSGRYSPAALKEFRGALSDLLKTTTNKDQWDYYLSKAHSEGTPDEVISDFGPWTSDAPERALQIGLTSAQAGTLRTAEERAQAATDREARLAGGGRNGLSDNAVRIIQGQKAETNAKTEDWVRKQWANDILRHRELWPKDANGKPTKPTEFSLDTASENTRNEFVRRRLQAENDERRQLGYAPLVETAKQAVQAGDQAGYEKIRDVYNELTQGIVKLESIVPWGATSGAGTTPKGVNPNASTRPKRIARAKEITDKLETERNPTERKKLQDELRDLAFNVSQ